MNLHHATYQRRPEMLEATAPPAYQFATILNPRRNRSRRPRRWARWLALAIILLGVLAVIF